MSLGVSGSLVSVSNLLIIGTSLVAQVVKNVLAIQETTVRSLDWEEPLRRE